MNMQIVALFFQEGGKVLSQLIRSRPVHIKIPNVIEAMESKSNEITGREIEIIQASTDRELDIIQASAPATTEKATSIASGCVPCAVAHMGTCSGLLNEAVRFSHGEEGMSSNEVLDRISMCMNELNAMERVDLRPEMVNPLPDWEKQLAKKALSESRATRHMLGGMTTPEGLSQAAGDLQEFQRELYRSWAKQRIKGMSPEEKTEMTNRILSSLGEEEESDD